MIFTIKKLGPDDVDLAKELFWFFQVDDNISQPVIPSGEYLHALLSKEDFHVLVAIQNEALIGGITSYELEMYKLPIREMFLYEIAVKPEFRQNGIGKALIEHLKRICVDKGIQEMYVGTTTNNTAAMKLYRATGGDEVADIGWFVYQCR